MPCINTLIFSISYLVLVPHCAVWMAAAVLAARSRTARLKLRDADWTRQGTIFLFLQLQGVTLEAHVMPHVCQGAGGGLSCNFKYLPDARAAGSLATMHVSFSHKIYEKSGYQRARIGEPIAACIVPPAAAATAFYEGSNWLVRW